MHYKKSSVLNEETIHPINGRRLSGLILSATMILALSVLTYRPAFGQDQSTPHASKYDNGTWYVVEQVVLKPGKRDDFLNIVKKYYEPAGRAVGSVPVMALENQTGSSDLTIIWRLKDGPTDLSWKVSPSDAAWQKQVVKLVGSKEKAKKIHEQYLSDIVSANSYIAFQEDSLAADPQK